MPKPKVWRMDIGHYGGMFVDIPAESFQQFKKQFPKREFPRKVRQKSVMKTFTAEGEARFHKKFPKSQGKYYSVYFGHASKGGKRLDKLYRCTDYK